MEDLAPGVGARIPDRIVQAIGGGKVRFPVRVTINGFTFRTTTYRMGGEPDVKIGLNRANKEATDTQSGKTATIDIEFDDKPRTVKVPRELAAAFKKNAKARAAWKAYSYSHKKEWADAITGAKKPETRARRVKECLAALAKKD